ncbi:hypothetical protein GQ42DRAFT_152391 [Ramicandelaber brevisporus]|nr:hypothetical protein GQ42DRAFT_152391 [Ramicandelaber brevisporus]
MEEDYIGSTSGGGSVPPSSIVAMPTVCDPNIIKKYIIDLLPVVMGTEEDLDAIMAIFIHPDASEKCRRFANDPSTKVLYVIKENELAGLSGSGAAGGGDESSAGGNVDDDLNLPFSTVSYSLELEMSYKPTHVSSLALVKRGATLDPVRPLHLQIQMMNLPGPAMAATLGASAAAASAASAAASQSSATGAGSNTANSSAAPGVTSPYEAMHAILQHVFTPYFDAFVASREKAAAAGAAGSGAGSGELAKRGGAGAGADDKDSKHGIPSAKKKIADLAVTLHNLQQNVEIPEIELRAHPFVEAIVKHCHANKKRVSIKEALEYSPDLAQDSSLLNSLHASVNTWIKEIQKVSTLARDPTTGSASQEINFWLSMERALEGIDLQLKRDEISLTLEILKMAKRYMATTSFHSDTGLNESLDMVKRYNQLMKEFPLNELLAATDASRLRDAIMLVFNHLNKKLRLCPYPISRALPLVEAISRDVNDVLIKILSSRRVMQMDFNDFEKLAISVDNVFVAWDEQVREFTNVAREITRRRSERFMVLKVTPAHTALRERFKYICQFRQQHEQLRSTVGKVMTGSSSAVTGTASAQQLNVPSASSTGLIGPGVGGGGFVESDAVREVRSAYEIFSGFDVLDTSAEGTAIWVASDSAYSERIGRIENQIIALLRDRLATAKNANEMFRVFSKFNALFFRQKIRNAVQEWQGQLLENVKTDIRALHQKFIARYQNSTAANMSALRDIPSTAGHIIWVKQIERQLDLYMSKVEQVLGSGWENYAEGARLHTDSNHFRDKLRTDSVFDEWQRFILSQKLSVSGKVFCVIKLRTSSGDELLQLSVNFDQTVVDLFKEVRNLIWLGFPVLHQICSLAADARRVHPYAVSLMNSARVYNATSHRLRQHHDIIPLAASYHIDAQNVIQEAFTLRWDHFVNTYESYLHAGAAGSGATGSTIGRSHQQSAIRGLEIGESRYVSLVNRLASVINLFSEKVDQLLVFSEDVDSALQELNTCAYTHEAIRGVLDKIQQIIDTMSLENYSNLRSYVENNLNRRIGAILLKRLETAVKLWTATFVSADSNTSNVQSNEASAEPSSNASGTQEHTVPALRPITHSLRIRNQAIYLDPPVEDSRESWFVQLQDWISIVCGQPRILASRYDLTNVNNIKPGDDVSRFNANIIGTGILFDELLSRVSEQTLIEAYNAIENRMNALSGYVKIWLSYQSLWDLESDAVYSFLGDDLSKWQQILGEIKRHRATFDTSESWRNFGTAIVDYEQVQSKVNAKYDSWQREILSRFGSRLGSEMKSFYSTLNNARNELEQHSAHSTETGRAVAFITFVQHLRKQAIGWAEKVQIFRQGQKALERQRYQFPNDFLYIDQVAGEWNAFTDILNKKNNIIQEQITGLQQKIILEDRAVDSRIKEAIGDWERSKPVQGDIKPDNAAATLAVFESRFIRLRDEAEQVQKAKEALDLDQPSSSQQQQQQTGTGGQQVLGDQRIISALEELNDLKAVWNALAGVWKSIYEMREVMWASVVPRKMRQQLEALLQSTKELPARMRQYAAFEYMQDTIKGYQRVNPVITDLRSEAIRERHWRQLFKTLRVEGRVVLGELTVGHVWDFDLRRNETIVREVITAAMGEMALEEFLKQVKETWNTYSLDLVPYQNKVRLIKGWDDLFAKCAEHVGALQQMRHSPYYKEFEDEASSWEDKLNRVHVLFDVWIDVQRQWVYLEGIFTGSADIRTLLPIEYARFSSINTEFMAVMKKVARSPLVLEVLAIQNVLGSLERLADLLGKIQKALGEYLEKQRASFPRFYFVGDEDLLEIIGNSKDVPRIIKHLKKMFAGLTGVQLDDDASAILGMSSREGESVAFKTPVSIRDNPRINDWLTLLEREMRNSLGQLLTESLVEYSNEVAGAGPEALVAWIEKYPGQLVVLAMQIVWSQSVESALVRVAEAAASDQEDRDGPLRDVLAVVNNGLDILSSAVLSGLIPLSRRKCESLITELVHQRDVIRSLIQQKASSKSAFVWLKQMRFYHNGGEQDATKRVTVEMASASFVYGWEYLGVPDRLVQTPLTDACYLTMTQALDLRLGGSPRGRAGTGKTESIKALGQQLGRYVLVFCCDEGFDYQAMGRIFFGLCMVGAWGCYDEFNRLPEHQMSAISQDIQSIQLGLRAYKPGATTTSDIELQSKPVRVSPNTGIFITMNPGYAGRSSLPDNLTKLFCAFEMNKPNREIIAEVMLYSQGFRTAEALAKKAVPLFTLCEEQLSSQAHYDFGLRALKSVLVTAGNVKRERIMAASESGSQVDAVAEQQVLIQSIRETVVPKLIADDIPLLMSLLSDVFPGVEYKPADLTELRKALDDVCREQRLVPSPEWLDKVIQVHQTQQIRHGFMLVGPSGSGKTTAWRTLLSALQRVDKVEGVAYVIDPKAMSKDELYGTLDQTTREWNDGLFTHILRRIIDNVRGENLKRHWIVFDGDVDPEWVENLNSVLDDNQLLTLPNGERLALPSNVRIMFEVESLRYATPATVSRCGMVWFSESVVTPDMAVSNYLETLRTVPLEDAEEVAAAAATATTGTVDNAEEAALSPQMLVQRDSARIFAEHMAPNGFVIRALSHAQTLWHIMDFTSARALHTLFALLNKAVRAVIEYNAQHPDFPLAVDVTERFLAKRLVFALVWSFAGDAPLDVRAELSRFIATATTIDLPPISTAPGASADAPSILDYEVDLASGEWVPWARRVPTVDIETHQVTAKDTVIPTIDTVTAKDTVIPTIDTVRHEELLYAWLSDHRPLILCGAPGSDMEVAAINFSSATTPELLLKTFEQYCEVKKTPAGPVMAPRLLGRWLVVFCDEINLPAPDKYGTQRVISFMRQLIECGGYWRAADKSWVRLERIQFVGACNPPTDPGRVPMTQRFLRHAPLVMVDYPGAQSLRQIYGTFARALLKVVPTLRAYAEPLTNAMVEVYLQSQRHFTPDIQAHYIYSPRELTRWTRGIYEAIRAHETLSVESLVRIWAHEALRLFQDRLVSHDERVWTDQLIDRVAGECFPTIDLETALARPILFSTWMSKHYVPVDRETLRDYARARLKVFCEEELDVQLVLFNDVLDHVLRIDRVFRQPQGHLLLIGVSGSGKTVLSRFVAWLNGISVFQVKVHSKYTGADFDEDLRQVLKRSGCKGEKICFIMDESNVLDSGFLERMNTLLANAEVPGLFEGDEYASLMTMCREGAQRDGLLLDSPEELYRWFTDQVQRNLHVVFTMNPPEGGLASRAATSPALFNRCVLDWFGDWSPQAFYQVAHEFTQTLDIDSPNYKPPPSFPVVCSDVAMPPTYRDAVVNAMVYVHQSLYQANARLARRTGRNNYATPRHYLDFIQHYDRLFKSKREDLEDQQRHLNVGLDKLHSTVTQVEELRASLAKKNQELERKNTLASEKLNKMVVDKQQAEEKKASSLKIQKDIARQNELIDSRKSIVLKDLANAEPAVLEAKSSVQSINKKDMSEVRAMTNPPPLVKMALEAVCCLLGQKGDTWQAIRGVIRSETFINSIIDFETSRITKPLREKMKRDFIGRPDFNFEKVFRASKACGPLVSWAIAQVNYSEILESVGPLRQEVEDLENSANDLVVQQANIESTITELEASIATYKDEYALLVSETQALKAEMERVKAKVDRSVKLLESLSSEQDRWQTASATFETQMGTIVGDVLLAAAFLAYAGFFDQQQREQLINKWSTHLMAADIQFKPDLALTEYLSTADERLDWQSKSLPADDLCTENAIMMERFNRYPLIIDPAGQAAAFLQNKFRDRKLIVTSFLDDAFVKNLESALRFGNPLLVHDVERLNPILNPVLNREIRRTGGRVLIRVGNQDIDFSPAFTLFLVTRDPSASFAPDICSRVTFVNFTVTRSSLQSQCLNKVLMAERPDVDKKRSDMMRVQGEFRLRLRHLEQGLLRALSAATGNILDDDQVITTLETLKREAAEVARKVEETEGVMQEIEQAVAVYSALAHACSGVFFVLEQLSTLNHFYQFSLDAFYSIFNAALNQQTNTALRGVTEASARLGLITKELFHRTFQRAAASLRHDDHLVLLLLLAQVRMRGLPESEAFDQAEFDFLMAGGNVIGASGKHAASSSASGAAQVANALSSIPAELAELIPHEMHAKIAEYSKLPAFRGLAAHIAQQPGIWQMFLTQSSAENFVPECWAVEPSTAPSGMAVALRRLLVVKCFRPERLLPAARMFAESIFDPAVVAPSEVDMRAISNEEPPLPAGSAPVAGGASAAGTPVIIMPIALCSPVGHDASYRVDNLVTELGVQCRSVAMGSVEGIKLADEAIASAAASGSWVFLKNVHLASGWLSTLEKKLRSLRPHRNFRLFMTMETHPTIPVNLLRMSRVLMFEPVPGIKANMLEALHSLRGERTSKRPVERNRLYFLIAWLHSIVLERLRYVPLGWTKQYDFNDSNLAVAFTTVDTWIDRVAGNSGRSNIAPENIPWDAISTLLIESVYGGQIDNDYDKQLLGSFVNDLFQTKSFDLDFLLVDAQAQSASSSASDSAVAIPDGTRVDQFLSWVARLPERQPPTWLGLHDNAEHQLLTKKGATMLRNVHLLKSLEEDDDDAGVSSSDAQAGANEADAQTGRMRTVATLATRLLALLPTPLAALSTPAANSTGTVTSPLYRVIAREYADARSLLAQVRNDFSDVLKCCNGQLKQTNHLRSLLADFSGGSIPRHWCKFKFPASFTLDVWVDDFVGRLAQLQDLATKLSEVTGAGTSAVEAALVGYPLNMGKLFYPEAYLTATRQSAAHTLGVSLEDLRLEFTISASDETPANGGGAVFMISGMRLDGARLDSSSAVELAADSTKLGTCCIEWVPSTSAVSQDAFKISLPVYLNGDRKSLLFSLQAQTLLR